MVMEAADIDEVIHHLTAIINTAHKENSRLGFFAALYRRVTQEVKYGIKKGQFEDGVRMELLDVAFANRYLAAYNAYREGQPLSESWRISFLAAQKWPPIMLQHLLLGMNAHINLDLGVAAATICNSPAEIDALEGDFDKINGVLASLVSEVVRECSQLWPFIGQADRMLRGHESAFIDVDLVRARQHAWSVAKKLSAIERDGWDAEIARLDKQVVDWGLTIWKPTFPLNLSLMVFRISRPKTIRRTIDILRERAQQREDAMNKQH